MQILREVVVALFAAGIAFLPRAWAKLNPEVQPCTAARSRRRLDTRAFGVLFAGVLLFGLAPFAQGAAAPTNDNFANAIVLSTNFFGTITNNNTGATAESGEPSHAGFPASHSIWYKWVAPANGEVSFNTLGVAGLDTVLAVYTGSSVSALTQVAANDDLYPTPQFNEKTVVAQVLPLSTPGVNTNPASVFTVQYNQPYTGPSELKFNATAGTIYYVAVDTKNFGTGPIPLNWAFYPSGVFRFAGEDLDIVYANGSLMLGGLVYQCSEEESFGDSQNTFQSYYTFDPQGLLVTVTRVGGYSGRVLVDYNTQDGSAMAGFDYIPISGTLVFDDFEMSKKLRIQIFPNGLGMNLDFSVVLSNPRLAPLENASVVAPPGIDPVYSMAKVEILSLYAPVDDPKQYPTVDTNGMITQPPAHDVFNFLKVHYYVPKDIDDYFGRTGLWIYRFPAIAYGGPAKSDGATINYNVNRFPEDDTAPDAQINNLFPLNPGSDYATPTPPNWNGIHGTNSDFDFVDGSVTFGANIGAIFVPISVTNDPLTKFNKEFLINLYRKDNNTLYMPGLVNEAHFTILFNDPNCPAGSVDQLYNPDLAQDMVFPNPPPASVAHPGTDGPVYGAVVQPNDQAVIVGSFSAYAYGDTLGARNNIARINQLDGSLDLTFDPGLGTDDFINSLVRLPNGQFLIGGAFASYNGTNRTSIARINSDGSLDTSFNPGIPGINGTVRALAVQSDGNIVIGGDFTQINGFSTRYIARLTTNGVLDPNFNPGANAPDGPVEALAITSSGQIVMGGQFLHLGGTALAHLARLNTNGTPDLAFNNNLGAGVDGTVWCLAPVGNQLYIGGDFTHVSVGTLSRIARLNPDGSVDQTFNPGSGADDSVYCITPQTDGTLYLGGRFTVFNGNHRLGLVRLFPNGTVDTGFLDTAYNQFAGLPRMYFNKQGDGDPRPYLDAVQPQSDGNLIIGGGFSRVGGGQASYSTRLDSDFPTTNYNTDVYIEPKSRDGIRNRNNVARLLGGATPSAGTLSLVATNLVVNRSQGFLPVSIVRTNGSLGYATANFTVPSGLAQGGVDFSYYDSAPIYLGSWRQANFPASAPNSTTRSHIDGLFQTNANPIDIYGHFWFHYTPGNAYVTLFANNGSRAGDVDTQIQLLDPQVADKFYLGGENIPLGVGLGNSVAPFTIHDDSQLTNYLTFSSAGYFVNESSTNAVITVARTNSSVGTVHVQFSTSDGTGHVGVNYGGITNKTLTFSAGVTAQTVLVPIYDDAIAEPNGLTVNLRLTGISGATYGLSNAVLNIIDNDGPPGVVNFSPATYTNLQSAPAAVVSVMRMGASRGTLTVQCGTTNGTALNNVNYIGLTNTLIWNDLEFTPKTLVVPLINNGLVPPPSNTVFQARLSNPFVNTISTPSALGATNLANVTLINNNSYGQLQFSSSSYLVNENGGAETISVIRVGGAAQALSVHYFTTDGPNAVSGGPLPNYVATSGTLTFNPGEVSKSFNVTILDDGIVDPTNFYFFVNLNNTSPAGVLGSPAAAQVNILDAETITQPAGAPDPTFAPNPGLDGDVLGVAVQPDGKIVAGGSFAFANGNARNGIARFNADATLDTTFLSSYSGANAPVQSVAVQTDGRVLIAGSFTTINGVNRNRIARLMTDGFFDTSFNAGQGADNTIFAVAETFVGANREILIGGSFLTVNGSPRSGLARLNNSAALDPGFDPGLTINGTVYAIAAYPTNTIQAGKILIGGSFTSVDGTNYNGIARLNPDGTLDLSFNPGAGATNAVRALAIQLDGRIVVGGSFTNFNGVTANHVTRLNVDGSLDSNFNGGVGADDTLQAIAIQQDTRIVLVGQFTHCSGVSRSRITRLMPDGTVDPTINFGAGADNIIDAVAIQPDGKLVIGGGFSSYDGAARAHLARVFGGSLIGSGSFEFTAANYSADENSTNAIITVRRRGGTTGNVSVDFSTLPVTAVPGVNYSNVSTTLGFPVGETFQSVSIPVMQDFQVTPDLLVSNFLSNPLPPSTLGNQSFSTLTILNDDSTMSFSAANYAVPENVVGGQFFVDVLRQGSSRGSTSVAFTTTTNGTAVPGVNYTPVTNYLTFLPGDTGLKVAIPVFNVPAALNDTTVTMVLTNPVNTFLVRPSQATLTIAVTNQSPGTLMLSQTNYTVGEADGSVVLTVVRTNGHSGLVSVNYATFDGSAVGGINYSNLSGVLNFADGETAKTITVLIRDLNQVHLGGFSTFFVGLTNAVNGAVLGNPSSAQVTIVDDGSGVAFQSPIYVGTETDGGITLGVTRVGTNDITKVSYGTSDGTATNGVHYVGATNQLTFNRGEFFKAVFIPFIRDTNVTGDLFFNVSLFGGTNLLNPSTPVQIFTNNPAIVTIKDADPGVLFTNANFGVLKSGTNVLITVIRTNVNTGTVNVGYSTADGTASAGADYTSTSGVLTFNNGIGFQSFTVPIRNNLQALDDRTFTVNLTNASLGTQLLPPSTATVTITNDTAGISFSSSGYTISEGSAAVIPVLRTGYTNSTVSVNFGTTDGTATSLNYTATNGTLVFTNGETSKNFVVFTKTDGIVTNNHTVLLGLSAFSPNAAPQNPNQATLTILESEGTLVVPAGAALVSESGPVNGAIDPGETVGVLLALRNSAGTNVANVQATLLATNGISSPSPAGPINYGSMVSGGPSVSKPFTFTANATNGQIISATLRLQYGGITNYAIFNFQVGQLTNSFTNSAMIVINDASNATPYPSTNLVSGLGNLLTHATVTLTNLYHQHPSDIDMILVSPTGTNTFLMAKAGGSVVLNPAVTVTFDDAAAGSLPQSEITSGSYRPTSYAVAAPNFPPPAPFSTAPGFYRTNLSVFNGSNPNGVWNLFVIDDSPGGAGVITNGWILTLTMAEIPSAADLAVGLTANPNPVVVTSNLTYTLYVTNYGPSSSSNIVVTDVFPTNAAFISSTPSLGAASLNASGQLVWILPALPNTGVASNSVVLHPGVVGSITNSVSVASATVDPNPDDDSATLVTAVSDFTADLAITVSGSPNPVLLGGNVVYTLTVTNLGPATATGVTISDTLPASSRFVSASPSGYVVAGNSVTFTNLGALGAGSPLSVTITAQPLAAGTLSDLGSCDSNVTDPLKSNNFMSIKTLVEALQFYYSGGNLVLTWPTDLGATVVSTTNLSPPVVWTAVTSPPTQSSGGTNSLMLPVSGGKMMFFRLLGQ